MTLYAADGKPSFPVYIFLKHCIGPAIPANVSTINTSYAARDTSHGVIPNNNLEMFPCHEGSTCILS
jgi:hypothetical protein